MFINSEKVSNVIKLSFIIPVYNAELYLERCIQTLYMQDLSEDDFEIIMVNDGSTDNSFAIAQKIANKHKNIKLFTQENQGSSVARNIALDNAKGKFVSFVDSDDYLIPHTLKNVLEVAEKKQTEICSFKLIMQYSSYDKIGSNQKISKMSVMSGEDAIMHGINFWSVCCSIFSLEFLNRYNLRFTKGIISQDSEFNMRAYPSAKRVIFTDFICYYYYNNAISTTQSKDIKKVLKKLHSLVYIAINTKKVATVLESSFLKKNYIYRSNSIIIGLLIALVRNSYLLSPENRKEIFEEIKKNKLYPIKGGTLSWKSSFLSLILNREKIIKKIMKI
ncbi:glycosyltransferase [Prevotella fusca]|uniref:glycosyltransferase n=1 Tax=Prevotella fusca TaxID=589436 RepID=UPI003FA166A8